MTHLKHFAAVGCPGVAEAPRAVLVPVENADLAIYRSSGAAVAVRVEGDCLDEVLVAMLQREVEGLLLVDRGLR